MIACWKRPLKLGRRLREFIAHYDCVRNKMKWPKYCPRCLDPDGPIDMKVRLVADWANGSGKRCPNCHWPWGDAK